MERVAHAVVKPELNARMTKIDSFQSGDLVLGLAWYSPKIQEGSTNSEDRSDYRMVVVEG
jgi:hypothetical protein